MIKIYVFSPPYLNTGGTEWLQQIAFELRKYPFFDVKMLYNTPDTKKSPQSEVFTKRYNNPYIINHITEENSVVIFPEIHASKTTQAFQFKKSIKFILWESVNFYLTTNQEEWLNFFLPETIHLSQCQYIREYLKFAQISNDKILDLTDCISDDFFNIQHTFVPKKENIITYNPKKGLEFTKKLINQSNFTFVPLYNLSTEQMISTLSKSKVYIDFGFHPGKDRIPREASLCGNCLITSTLGSARYYEDVPIPDKYKVLPIEENIPKIINIIQDLFDNYEERKNDFEEHRKMTLREKEGFLKGIKKLEERIIEEYEKRGGDLTCM